VSEGIEPASLPDGWTEARVAELTGADGVFTDGDWVLKEHLQRPGNDVRLLQLGNLGVGEFRLESERWISTEVAEELGCTFLEPGDVLISRMADPLARAAVLPDLGYPCITAVDVAILRCDTGLVEPRFLMFAMNSPLMRERAERHATGTTRKRISRKNLGSMVVPLAPRAEQDRIVAAIEAAMAGIEGAVGAIGEAEQLLDVHRAAVLEAECLGRVGGEDHAPAANGPPGIPQGWEWRPVAELAANEDRAITDGPFGSNLKTAHYTDSGPRVIRLQNIGEGEFIDAEAHISREHFERLRAHEARTGDVVIASLGESLPRACVIPEDLGPAIVKADCPRIRVGDEIRAEFLCAALNSPPVRRHAARLIAGIGRPRLTLAKLKQLRIPTPPLAEQDRALRRIRAHAEARNSVAETLAKSLEAEEALRRSILHRAFEGRLVPQGPSDPPASDLLARLYVAP
jgi:type I restriction enzyme S subunit